MKKLWRRLLGRLATPPFEGRWSPRALEEAVELDLAAATPPEK